jgi:hypothetical protein
VSHERVRVAAENNARWCDAVCRAHGLSCEFTAGAWVTRDAPPPYYPNLVTIRGSEAASQQQKLIREILTSDPRRSFSLKDSFCCIDPTEAGGGRPFDVLFEATWIWSDATSVAPRNTAIRWANVESETELLKWERAWRGDAANQPAWVFARQFPASLLANRDIAFLAGTSADDEIIAVAVANRTSNVIGLSNVFGRAGAAELWPGAASAARKAFPPGLPLVGYERGDDLRHATSFGFHPIGPLRVYVLNPDNTCRMVQQHHDGSNSRQLQISLAFRSAAFPTLPSS